MFPRFRFSPFQLLLLAAFAALVALVLGLSWVPDPEMTRVRWIPRWISEWADDFVRLRTAVPFVPLGFLAGLWVRHRKGGFNEWVAAWGILSAVVLVAELGQVFIPRRVFDWEDVMWGMIGSGLGLVGVKLRS